MVTANGAVVILRAVEPPEVGASPAPASEAVELLLHLLQRVLRLSRLSSWSSGRSVTTKFGLPFVDLAISIAIDTDSVKLAIVVVFPGVDFPVSCAVALDKLELSVGIEAGNVDDSVVI